MSCVRDAVGGVLSTTVPAPAPSFKARRRRGPPLVDDDTDWPTEQPTKRHKPTPSAGQTAATTSRRGRRRGRGRRGH